MLLCLQGGKVYKDFIWFFFMLWEKKNLKNLEKRGYLYLRETIYVRDGRTLKRKPKKLGDGSGARNRGKYSVKKDVYCGKIVPCFMKKFLSFKEFLKLDDDCFFDYRLNSEFLVILEDFIRYLVFIFEIDETEFEKKNFAYEIAGGFLCEKTIDFLKRFVVRSGFDERVEIERFANRCLDCGIFDNEVIISLFSKIAPEDYKDVRSEIESLRRDEEGVSSVEFDRFSDFLRGEHRD